jgi:hypothetical protein
VAIRSQKELLFSELVRSPPIRSAGLVRLGGDEPEWLPDNNHFCPQS